METINKKCRNKECSNEFKPFKAQKYCSDKCGDRVRYLKHKEYYIKNARAWEKRNPERRKEISKKAVIKFRKNNPKRFNKLIMKSYSRNKNKWVERKFVGRHREKLKDILSKSCLNCGLNEVNEIHHTTYIFPKRTLRKTKKEMKEYLIWYAKYLRPFCSKKCHSDYERKIKLSFTSDKKSLNTTLT